MVFAESSDRGAASGPQRLQMDERDRIAGVQRTLAVIEAFNDEHGRMTVSQVAQRTAIPRTAARRYLLNLVDCGYADTDGKLFWLTPRVLRLGQSYLDAARLPRLVQPFIQRLSMRTGETVNVSVLDGHEVVYVARSNSPRVVSIGFYAGARVPAHVVSPGATLLSAVSEAELQAWLAVHEFASFTTQTQLSAESFAQQVHTARRQNYWISVGQLDVGLSGVAVVLRDRHGDPKGALGMTLQSTTWPEARITDSLVPLLQETAQELRGLL